MIDTNQVLYSSLPRRIKASIIDGVVLLLLMVLSPLAISTLIGRNTAANAFLMYMPPLLLEPFLISYLGYTLGQYIFGIQVIRASSGGKCPLATSFLRYFVKAILGGFSMTYMLFCKKHQAIHDHLAKTLVVLSSKKIEQNPKFARYGETEQNLEEDGNYNYPSAFRRFSFFCIWAVIALFVLGPAIEIAALLLAPGYSFANEKNPKQIDVIFNLLYSMVFIGLAILASKGYLPGAKRKLKNLE